MDYSCEPNHSTRLLVCTKEPFNAEPTASALVEFSLTPEDLVYCRNHGPVREFNCDHYTITFEYFNMEYKLTMNNIKSLFTKVEVVAALQCAGIRRKEMGAIKPVHGIPWGEGVVANCRWGGARLRDILHHLQTITGNYANSHSGFHVCFSSYATLCQDDKYYGASIPLTSALESDPGVILAYEMNGEDLSADHGAPVRIVAPGYLGARWVKWVDTISISSFESPNFYQQLDYKVLPPEVETKEAAKLLWSKHPAMTSLPLNSIIAIAYKPTPETLFIKGYALPGPTGNVTAVEISLDDGQTWQKTSIIYQDGRYSWTIWEGEVPCTVDTGRLYSRAIDSSGQIQPRTGQWNLRGVAFNGWGKMDWDSSDAFE